MHVSAAKILLDKLAAPQLSFCCSGRRLLFVFGGACWYTLIKMPLMQFLRIVHHRGSHSLAVGAHGAGFTSQDFPPSH